MRCPPTVLTLHDRAPERHASDHASEDWPGRPLSLHDVVFEVGGRLLRVRGRVDPASTALLGGTMVRRTPSSPGWKEEEGSMSTRREELVSGRPESGVDEARKPRPLPVGDDKPAPPTHRGFEVVGGATQPRPLRAPKDPRSARAVARSVPLEARDPRAARPYTCASVRRPPLPTLRMRSRKGTRGGKSGSGVRVDSAAGASFLRLASQRRCRRLRRR
jgi:hypothetical protein